MKGSSKDYKHGGAPQLDMRRLGFTEKPVLDFSVNLNPLGPPPNIKEKWLELFQTVEPYPSIEADGVSRYYQQVCGIASENILVGNGSTELIYLVPRVLGFKRAAVFTPSFHDYERASRLAGAQVFAIPLLLEDGFQLPAEDSLIEILSTVDALWVANPNNPTGNLISKERILSLAKRFSEKWFIVDEAFVQFQDGWREKSFLTDKPAANILVLHSLTKFYAIAGLRLGGVIGHEDVIKQLKDAKEPWTVNGIANQVAILLTDCDDYEMESIKMVNKECQRVFQAVNRMEGIGSFLPSANFVLCQWRKTDDLDDLLTDLLKNGMYVRDCRNFKGLEENFFRVGFRMPNENDRLLEVIAASVNG